MLSVILIWIYMIWTTFMVGYGVLRFLTRHLAYSASKRGENTGGKENAEAAGGLDSAADRRIFRTYGADAYVMCGLVCVTVYAQFFSLFAGVGLGANVVLCAVCIAIFLRERQDFFHVAARFLPWRDDCAAKACMETGGRHLREKNGGAADQKGEARNKRYGLFKFCAVIVLFFLFAYGTSRGIPHYDTALYHAQSIRWIEEYGVVKGLGNLHCRLAYNSSSFALSALYSMAFLGKGSFHCGAGFFAFVLAAGCLRLVDSLRERKLRASDFARVMCVYYLVNVFDEMISPASDYFMVLIAFYLVITWLSLAENGEKEIFPYALLCVLAVFLMTVKLSAAFILLLTMYPACRLVREKRWGQTGIYLGLGSVTALPFLIRNVLISGWLVYPFTRIDLFDVVWKIPKGVADYDAREIQVWGRGYADVARYAVSPMEWLPDWFRALAGSDKVFVMAAGLAVAVLVVWMAYFLWQSCFSMKRQAAASERGAACKDVMASSAFASCGNAVFPAMLTAQGTVAASFLFWLCTSPLIRYGCVYVYLTPAVVFGGIYAAVMEAGGRAQAEGIWNCEAEKVTARWRLIAGNIVCTAVLLLLAYKVFALGCGIVTSHENKYWILQKDYENFAAESCEIEGVTFYYPVEGDRTGYDAFPAAPAKPQIVFLGDGLADGFRAADSAVPSIRQ